MKQALAAVAMTLLLGCQGEPPPETLKIEFGAEAGGRPATCDAVLTLDDGRDARLMDLRFFVSDLEVVDGAGARAPLAISADSQWRTDQVALIDLEDGEGECANGSASTSASFVGQVPAGDWAAVEMTLGVPFTPNHANPATAEPPLNVGSLHWSWRGGYKFIRLEAQVDGEATRLHLGSTGCDGSFHEVTACARPNRARIRVPLLSPHLARVELDLDQLLAGRGSCMGGPEDVGCAAPFAALGLDLQTGRTVGPATAFGSAREVTRVVGEVTEVVGP